MYTRQRGLSLIELVMFMVIMGIAAVTVLQLLNMSTKASAEPVRRKQALLLAEALMEEVQQARFTFCDPSDPNAATATSATSAGGTPGDTTKCAATVEDFGPENGETRPYNNVNDYVTVKSTAQQSFLSGGQLVDAAGQAMGGAATPLTGFTATVSMEPATLGPDGMAVLADATPANMEALHITINVAYGNDNVTLDGYRTRYAPRTTD